MVDVPSSPIFESVTVSATSGGASGTVLFTVPSNHDATVEFLTITNGASSSQTVTIEIYKNVGTSYKNLYKATTVAGNTVAKVLDADRLSLSAGDKIVCSKNGGTIDVSMSGRLYYNPNR